MIGGRHAALRLLLAAWVVLALGLTFGAWWSTWLLAVPGFRLAALFRYLPASWILCLCVLAALAIDDVQRGGARRWFIPGAAVLLAGSCAVLVHAVREPHVSDPVVRVSTLLAGCGLLLLAAAALAPRLPARWRAAVFAATLTTEAVAWFVVPTLSYPRHGAIDRAGVDFLKQHLGLQRAMALGTLQPNYGAFFGIAFINHNDLPVPLAWTDYIHDRLDANASGIIFNGDARANPAGPSAADELLRNRANYAAIGVRYVMAPPQRDLPGLTEVFRGRTARIYELPDPAPDFAAPGCTLRVRSRTELEAACPAPATLTRLELAMPGWRAWVGGTAVPITTTGRIFQSVPLPAGESRAVFAFRPPFLPLGAVLAVAGLLLLLAAHRPQATVRLFPRIRLR